MAREESIITLVVLASAANAAGAIIPPWEGQKSAPTSAQTQAWSNHNHDPFVPVITGFIVGAILLGIAQAVPELALAFAGAFTITSLLINGQPMIAGLDNIIASRKGKS